jgi:hypothetical protein
MALGSRVRAMLVEIVWRMMRWQPDYIGLKKWMPVLGDPIRSPVRSPAAGKKAIVAIARQLAVDLWRLFTGQTTANKLGLIYLRERKTLVRRTCPITLYPLFERSIR